MKKKVIAMMTAVSIMAGMLTGCGSETGSANDATVAQTKEEGSISTENTGDGDKVVLRFSWWGVKRDIRPHWQQSKNMRA